MVSFRLSFVGARRDASSSRYLGGHGLVAREGEDGLKLYS